MASRTTTTHTHKTNNPTRKRAPANQQTASPEVEDAGHAPPAQAKQPAKRVFRNRTVFVHGLYKFIGQPVTGHEVADSIKSLLVAFGFSSQLVTQARIHRQTDKDNLFVEFATQDLAERFLAGSGSRLAGTPGVYMAYAKGHSRDPTKRREQILRRFSKLGGTVPAPPAPGPAQAQASADDGPHTSPTDTPQTSGNAHTPSELTTSEGVQQMVAPAPAAPESQALVVAPMDTETRRKRTLDEAKGSRSPSDSPRAAPKKQS